METGNNFFNVLSRSLNIASSIFAYLWAERFPLFIIFGFFGFSSLLVSPLRDVPIIDDWTYAWSVEQLLKTGRLALLDWSAHYPIFQVLWGGLFSFLFGFSFGVLRLSTVLLAISGCAALYLTLRELDLDRQRSLLGALMLAVNPVFFVLSFSFMTDVPFLSMMNIAVLCYVAGVKRERQVLLWAGGLFVVAAFLSRQIGILIPLALLPYLVLGKRSWSEVFRKLLPLAGTILCTGLLWLWLLQSLGRTSVMAEKVQAVRYLSSLSLLSYLKINLDILLQLIFSLFPILLAGLSLKRLRWSLGITLLAVGTVGLLWWHFGELPSLLADGNTWSLNDLANVRGLVLGKPTSSGTAERFSLLARLLLLISTAILIAGTAHLWFKQRAHVGVPALVMLTSGLLQLGLINAMWFYYDRYYLVLLPSFIYYCLKLTLKTGFSRVIALSGAALLAFVSVSGTWDALRFNQALVEAFNELRATGVAAAEIDAGYSLAGWILYAHPENLPPGAKAAEDVEWVTTDKELPYAISNAPLPGYETLKEISWKGSLWAVSNRVYVLHKQDHIPN